MVHNIIKGPYTYVMQLAEHMLVVSHGFICYSAPLMILVGDI